jgi:hypothetical protein
MVTVCSTNLPPMEDNSQLEDNNKILLWSIGQRNSGAEVH